MSKKHSISSEWLSLEDVRDILHSNTELQLSTESKDAVERCRNYLDKKIEQSNEPVYGVNTGFGSLYNKHINTSDLSKLQENLVKSHACGTGNEVPHEIVKIMLLLKVQSLAYGHSGVQLQTINRLIDFYNHDIIPVVYEMGSLGASGDLAPLAHLSLPLLGEGEAYYQGKKIAGADVLKQFGWQPITFKAKEGLALLNGTQLMAAYGVYACLHSHHMLRMANKIAGLSLDAFDGRIDPFKEMVHKIRPHEGQQQVAEKFREMLESSELQQQEKQHVQDPYSFRCIPQVHGASMDAITHVTKTILTEINGVTDNPNVFPDEDEIISAGNFHGQPLALVLDYLSIALAELGSISERRTFQLISGARELPNYLVANPGINSGLMIPQYTAASLVSQNKQLATPASVDSIVSSNGQEDHVSMGANAATKLSQIIDNLYAILAIELITASQALTFRRPLKTSPELEDLVRNFRKVVPFISEDRIIHNDIQNAIHFLKRQIVA